MRPPRADFPAAGVGIQKLKGELVDRARAETLMFRLAREERDGWVIWPARVAALMASELAAALGEEVTVEAALMQKVLEAQAQRLLVPAHAIRVLRQGSGRAITGEHRLRKLFNVLEAAPLNNDTINALAMAVSRRGEAPRALTRAQVDHFLHELSGHLIGAIQDQNFNVKFKNTLSAIAGFFRWREIEPFALLAADDRVAADLQQALKRASDLLRQPQWWNVPARAQKIKLLEKIAEFLEGEGDPAILRIIEDS